MASSPTYSTFVALYRGRTISDARLLAVSADPALIADVSARLLCPQSFAAGGDPVITELERGRRQALHLVQREVANDRTR